MTRLLIVDDDAFIREGLKNIIDWDELGIEIVATAENGKQALEEVIKCKPHIVVTDIRMPGGDGLEFIQTIREKGITAHVIVLSGYDEYDYIRTAMKFGVDDYLLKPIDESELREVVISCCNQIEEDMIREQLNREKTQLLRTNLWTRWIENRITQSQLKEKMAFIGFDLSYFNLFQVAIISWRNLTEGEIPASEAWFRSYSIHNCIEEILTQDNRGVAFVTMDKNIVCVLRGSNEDIEYFTQNNLLWMNAQSERIASLLKTPWYCTLGQSCNDFSLVHQSYKEAMHLQNFIHFTQSTICIDSTFIEIQNPVHDPIPSLEKYDFITNSLRSGNRTEWCDFLNQDFVWALRQQDALSASKYVLSEWSIFIKQAIKRKKQNDVNLLTAERNLLSLFHLDSIQEIKQQLFTLLFDIEKQMKIQATERRNPIISQVEQYLNEHFHEELTLQILSSKFHVNNIYLGRLFKEETGELFSDYLTRLRFEKAKELLSSTHLKAAEIASQVGFLDANYFYRKFKQETGLSPTEYRNLNE